MSVIARLRRFEFKFFPLLVVLKPQVLLLLTVAFTTTLNNMVSIAIGPASASVTATIITISITTVNATNSL